MIFLTVGHQMPFDRLVRAVDEWASRGGAPAQGSAGILPGRPQIDEGHPSGAHQVGGRQVIAQVGLTDYQPRHMKWMSFVTPREYDQYMREASAIVAHAGTGTIIAALKLGKPLLVMPRLSRLGETRNDHQIPTARHFAERGHILAANDERDLPLKLDEIERFRPHSTIGDHASPELLSRLRQFVIAAT